MTGSTSTWFILLNMHDTPNKPAKNKNPKFCSSNELPTRLIALEFLNQIVLVTVENVFK